MTRKVAPPKQIKVPADKLAFVTAVHLWADAMPAGLDLPDSVHESIEDVKMSVLPSHKFFERGYCSHLEIRNGVLHAALATEMDVGEQYIYVPVVAR